VYTIIDHPGCISTTLTGINDVGQIVGYCEVGVTAGFVYDLTSQSFVDLNIPNSSATYPYGINDLGMVAGYYLGKAAEVGFVKSGSTLDTLHVPNASATLAYGITASGEAVGNVIIGAGYGRLLANAGEYKLIEIPKVPGARVFGVSPEGAALVGSSKDNSHAFISRGKNTVLLQPASAVFAAANGVNASGVVVGYFTDAASATHGFTWTTLR
ncbi:MAG: hypothetical protein H0X25_23355, partial [Acidobacteriales bacterium]|nr:hypothetical protein [Terriglobales bacterium]